MANHGTFSRHKGKGYRRVRSFGRELSWQVYYKRAGLNDDGNRKPDYDPFGFSEQKIEGEAEAYSSGNFSIKKENIKNIKSPAIIITLPNCR